MLLVQEGGNIHRAEAGSGVETDVCSVSNQATLASMWSTMAIVMWRTSEFRPDGCKGVDLEPQCGSRVLEDTHWIVAKKPHLGRGVVLLVVCQAGGNTSRGDTGADLSRDGEQAPSGTRQAWTGCLSCQSTL